MYQILVHMQKFKLKLTIKPIKLMGKKILMIKIIWLEQEEKKSAKKDKKQKINQTEINF